MLNKSRTEEIRRWRGKAKLIKLSLKKNRRHRLAEKYICRHFDPLIQLRFIYSRTVRELHLPRVRARTARKGKRKDGWRERGEDLRVSQYKEVEYVTQRLLMPPRDAIFRSQSRTSERECAESAPCSLFNCSAISYNANSSSNTGNSCQMAAASKTTLADAIKNASMGKILKIRCEGEYFVFLDVCQWNVT